MAVKIFWLCSALALAIVIRGTVTGTLSRSDLKFRVLTKFLTGPDQSVPQLEGILQELLLQLKLQVGYENVVLFRPPSIGGDCPFVAALGQRTEPQLVTESAIENYKQRFPTQTLVLRCEHAGSWNKNGLLKSVISGLRHVSYLNLLDTGNTLETNASVMATVLEYCKIAFKSGIFHLIVLLPDFGVGRRYFICYQYPEAQARQRYLAAATNNYRASAIFESQYSNLHGAPLWTQPDLMPSRTMLYYDKRGKLHMMGYVANVVKVFAQHLNATMRFRFPVQVGKIVHNSVLENAVRNGSIDIATSIVYLMQPKMLEHVSYPYDVIKYCIMMPMPKPIHRYEVYANIITPGVFAVMCACLFLYSLFLLYSTNRLTWTTACTNLEMIRAMLAQPFRTVRQPRLLTKFIIFQISYTFYLVSNMYSAFLKSYLTETPLMPADSTFSDVKRDGLKVLLVASDLPLMEGITEASMHSFITILQIEHDFEKYERIRTSMDMNYIYPVSDRRWQIFDENQKFFQRRVFYYTDKECIRNTLLMSFPLRPDLPYRDLFDDFILRMHCMGFVQRWTSLTFYWMTKFRFLQYQDPSLSFIRAEKALSIDDFRWALIGYGCLTVFSFLVLLLELFGEYWTKNRTPQQSRK